MPSKFPKQTFYSSLALASLLLVQSAGYFGDRLGPLAEYASKAGGALTLIFGLLAIRALRKEARERAGADAAKLEAEAQFRMLIENSPEAIFINQAGKVVFANPACVRLLGFERPDALYGRSPLEFIRADFHDAIRQRIRELESGCAVDTLEEVFVRRDGTEVPVEVIAVPARFGGRPAIHVVARDLTDRRRSEGELRMREERFRALVTAGSQIIWLTDAQGDVCGPLPAWQRFTGQTEAEIQGHGWSRAIHPDDLQQAMQLWMDAVAARKPVQLDYRLRRHDGVYRQVADYAVPVLNPDGSVREWIGTVTDVTEKKQWERAVRIAHDELRQANAQLARASRLKDEFLANMSHELRTPLNAILGLSEMLLEQTSEPLSPRQIKSLTTIQSSGQHLLSLINDILDLSKIEAGKLDLNPESIHVDEFCQSCFAFIKTQAAHKRIDVEYASDSNVGTIAVDPRRLKQMLVNLLSNAVKFTPDGGRIGLTVAGCPEEQVVRFTVWDTGIGIAAEDQPKLFRAFSQIDSGLTRAQEGTGLGLVLVARLAELHGGSINLQSEPGQGSRFTLTLPWIASSAREQESAKHPKRRYRHALIIEDEAVALITLRRYLSELGLTSVEHTTGTNAVEAAIAARPDVILLDIQLPGENGWGVLSKLKQHPATSAIPVVVISVVDDPKRAADDGAVAHFTKPVTREQLANFFQRPLRLHTTDPAISPVSASASTILLAEDNEANIQTIGGYLEEKGFSMRYARNGAEAVALAREIRPALILMDVQMPVMDGLMAMRELRQDPQFRKTPIIALTALAMAGDRERCLAAGATDYMSKPVKLKELFALLTRLLPV